MKEKEFPIQFLQRVEYINIIFYLLNIDIWLSQAFLLCPGRLICQLEYIDIPAFLEISFLTPNITTQSPSLYFFCLDLKPAITFTLHYLICPHSHQDFLPSLQLALSDLFISGNCHSPFFLVSIAKQKYILLYFFNIYQHSQIFYIFFNVALFNCMMIHDFSIEQNFSILFICITQVHLQNIYAYL